MGSIAIIYLNYSEFEYSQINIGLSSIFTYLKENNHSIYIFDTFYYSNEQILRECTKLKLDFVGFSTTEIHLGNALSIAKKIRSQQNTKIIFGGPYCIVSDPFGPKRKLFCYDF